MSDDYDPLEAMRQCLREIGAVESPAIIKPKPLEVVHLPITGPGSITGAIGFMAVLAYPNEIDKRDAFLEAGQAYAIRMFRPKDRKVFPGRLRKYPARRILDKGPLTAGFRRITTRRILAARMLGVFFLKHFGAVVTVEQAAKQVALNSGRVDCNFVQRVWAESKPVIHMAWAMQMHLNDGGSKDIFAYLRNPDWLAPVIEASSKTIVMVHADSTIGLSYKDMIEILPE